MAESGEEHVDSYQYHSNEKLLKVMGKKIRLLDAFKSANDVLLEQFKVLLI